MSRSNVPMWDNELEFGLPDCRLNFDRANKQREGMTIRGRMWMERVFCANCGCDGGLVTPEFAAHIFYLCLDCVDKHGAPPGTIEVVDGNVHEKA